jgi:hypothetical protein
MLFKPTLYLCILLLLNACANKTEDSGETAIDSSAGIEINYGTGDDNYEGEQVDSTASNLNTIKGVAIVLYEKTMKYNDCQINITAFTSAEGEYFTLTTQAGKNLHKAKYPLEGKIEEVHAADMDNDQKPEIAIVINQDGFNTLNLFSAADNYSLVPVEIPENISIVFKAAADHNSFSFQNNYLVQKITGAIPAGAISEKKFSINQSAGTKKLKAFTE